MKIFVVEHIPQGEEESELLQAGDSTSELMTTLSTVMLTGNRIVSVHKNGQPMDANELLPIYVLSAKFLAVERLGTSLGLKVNESIEKFWCLIFGDDMDDENQSSVPPKS